ncbi:MAG: hypothetical protein MZV70_12260 [Desulfobacterales bacterium]|nr:hypothetical protein [Desulfobacterales bacterium]
MIITGGEHVYPSEVEEAVGSHECVFDCAVVGLPDDKWGEKVAAVIITQPGVDPRGHHREGHHGVLPGQARRLQAPQGSHLHLPGRDAPDADR